MKYFLLSLLALFALPALAEEAAGRREIDDSLIYRITVGRVEDVRILLERGANPNARNEQGIPAIAIAAERWDAEAEKIVSALAEKGATLNYPAEPNNDPLIIATRLGNAAIVKDLIARGANYYIRDEAGRSLIEIAAMSGRKEAQAVIQAAIDADRERRAAERSMENLNRLVRRFSYENCAVQYLRYYVSSEQDKLEDEKAYEQRIQGLIDSIAGVNDKLRELFHIRTEDLRMVSSRSLEYIYQELEEMVSNRNRRQLGVGQEKDLERRCGKIANRWEVVAYDGNEKLTDLSKAKGPVKVQILIR